MAAVAAVAASTAPSTEPTPTTTGRSVVRIVSARQMREGGGFMVRRPVGGSGLSSTSTDPFLMLDHLGPVDYGPGEAVGAPDHPHRGFETVTYLLEGEIEHKDSQGNRGLLSAGWVQWMTAGSGVIHSEMPSESMLERGGRMEGFQLWVNLPAALKMCPPRYQDTPPEALPSGTTHSGARVKVIAGQSEASGKLLVSPIETRSPMLMVDIAVPPGASFVQRVDPGFSGFVYAYRGAGQVSGSPLIHGEAGLLSEHGETVTLTGGADQELRVLLVAGVPLGEPIVQHGPFVMNTEQEILQAFLDFQRGELGEIEGAREREVQTAQARAAQAQNGRWQRDQGQL